MAKSKHLLEVSAIRVNMFTLLVEVTKLMPVESSEGFCDAVRSIICSASDQQQ